VVRWFQQRALTVYLWHVVAIGILQEWVQPHFGSLVDGEVGRIGCTLVLTVVLATALGWIEDLAAGRPPRLFPDVSGRAAARPEASAVAARVTA
jgi:peptidoglycan/LPS O-acetylase OafA/YrhL